MPDDRFIHRRLGHSEKINHLSDFEFRVWVQYVLSSDDFGVMRCAAAPLQADNDALASKPTRAVQKAVDNVIAAGLLQTFTHQGRVYCYQSDWQEFQRVDYPRTTLHPCAPLDALSPKTRELFGKHPGGWGRKAKGTSADGSPNVPRTSSEHSEDVPQTLDGRSGEITPEPLAVSRKPLAVSREPVVDERSQRAGAFGAWYAEKHEQIFGIGYMGSQKDWVVLLQLVDKFTDQQLRDAAVVWFGMDDDFATRGTRTVPKFASRITGCLQTMQQRGIA